MQHIWRKPSEPQPTDQTPELSSPEKLSAYEASWPFAPHSPTVQNVLGPDKRLVVMLVDLTGLDWPEIEPLLPAAQSAANAQGMIPILIVDLIDFAGLRQTEFAYDVLPAAGTHTSLGSDLDWTAYIAKRRTLLLDKWRPAVIVHLSQRAEGWT